MSDPLPLHCSYCDRSQHQVGNLIAGPFVALCNNCIGAALVSLCTDCRPATAVEPPQDRSDVRGGHCAFCGKGADEVKRLLARGSALICNECLVLSLDILLGEQKGLRGVQKF